jgi:hypothetical protein
MPFRAIVEILRPITYNQESSQPNTMLAFCAKLGGMS